MPLEAYVPDELTLRSFLLGRLSASEAQRVERYLETHPEAASTLEALSGEDTFTSALTDSAAVEAISPEVQSTMDRLEQSFSPAREQTATAEGTDDSKTGSPSQSDESENTLDFLALAQQPDELGRLGGYRILRVLGAGGMGMVLEAEDPKLGRHVAIKVMLPKVASNAKARDRFVREARAAAKVEHDHIIPIYFIGEENKVPFIVMPFLKGESLDARLKREERLSVKEIVRIGREVAEGLAAAHDLGLVHRDIKPANLWLEAPRGRMKILDFGLARLNSEAGQLTQSGAIVGTPAYMAPEQARSQPVDGRSDLFSLGAVLYKMATGRTPFGGSDTISMLMSLANDTPVNARNLNPDIPPSLADLISRLLEKDPAKRPQMAQEVVQQLAPPPTVEAMPVSGERRAEFEFEGEDRTHVDKVPMAEKPMPKHLRSHGLLIGVAAALLVLILGGGFAGYKLFFETKYGTLIVEIKDKDTEFRFRNGELHLLDADGKLKYTLKPSEKNRQDIATGDYKVRMIGPDGVELDTDAFEMKKGGLVTLRVTAKPAVVKKDAPGLDRRAAEYVLSIGGAVRLNEQEREIRTIAELPKTEYRLTGIIFHNNKLIDDAGLARFRGMSHLRHIELWAAPISDAGIAHLKDNKDLLLLNLGGTRVTDAGLAVFGDCKHIEFLGLRETQTTNAGLAHFSNCANLTFLDCTGSRVDDAGLRPFKNCKSLESLQLAGLPVTDEGVAHFQNTSTLTHLLLKGTRVTPGKITELAKALPYCKIEWDGATIEPKVSPDRKAAEYVLSIGGTVHLHGVDSLTRGIAELPREPFSIAMVNLRGNQRVTDSGLAACAGLKRLVHIDLVRTPVTDAGLAHFAASKNLITLDLVGAPVGDEGLAIFKGISTLQHLWLSYTKVTDVGLANFANSKGLINLDLVSLQITDRGLSHYAGNTNLAGLFVAQNPVTDVGLANFKDCKNLTHLWVGDTQLTDNGLAYFKDCKNLVKLWAGGTKLTDAGLVHFKDCKNLVDLSLMNTMVTDKGLANFQDCKKLTSLWLSGTDVTDTGIASFKDCNSLSEVYLDGTKLSDLGLAQFKNNKSLAQINVKKTNVTEPGIIGLKQALPSCKIGWDGDVIEPKSFPLDSDRQLAIQVVKVGGSVIVQQLPRVMKITTDEEFPAGDFDVTYVGLVKVTDANFAIIANLLRGKTRHNDIGLSIINSQLNDDSLKHLVGSNITRLALRINNFSDAGLIHLLGIKNLKSLVIHDSERVSKSGVEKLAKALPGCTIESTHGMFNVKAIPATRESTLPAIELGVEQRKSLESVLNVGGRLKIVEKGTVLNLGPGDMLPAGPLATVDVNFKDVPIGDMYLENLRHVPPVHNMLHLGSTNVTDEGLLSIAKFRGLAAVPMLNLQASKVTADGVKKLANTLPKSTIVSDHGRIEPKPGVKP